MKTRASATHPRGQKNGGFALLVALWLIVAAAFLLTTLAVESRPERLIAANAREKLQARVAARAGIAHILARLDRLATESASSSADNWNQGFLNGSGKGPALDSIALPDGARYSVRLRDLGARLPLNAADGTELRRFFRALGASFRTADVAAQSVMDWRDEDGLHRAAGAEWDDFYQYRDPPIRPRNGPMQSVRELQRVRGVDEDLYDRAAPHLTVRFDGPVNINTASRPVLRALVGLDQEAVTLILHRRATGRPFRSLVQLQGQLSAGSADRLARHFPRLSRMTSFQPRRLVVTSMGKGADARVTARVQAILILQAGGVQVVWRVES